MQKNTLIVPGRFDSLARIADFIGQAAAQAGFDQDSAFHIQMAVDEACSNVIEHAYGASRQGDIELAYTLEEGALIITIHDTGRSFDPSLVPEPPLGASLEDLPEGGLGLYFMRRLMDEVRFEFDPAKGNTLTMVKRSRA